MTDRIYYNDEPVLEVGRWRVLIANMFGKKYKGIEKPLLIHKCPKEFRNLRTMNAGEEEREFYDAPDRSDGNPKCKLCHDPVPDEIQGLLAMYYWDGHGGSDGG